MENPKETAETIIGRVEGETGKCASLVMDATFEGAIQQELIDLGIEEAVAKRILGYAESSAKADTDRTTFQAMEALLSLIHIWPALSRYEPDPFAALS